MRTIWKFPLPIQDAFAIVMPVGAEVLSVQTQQGAPMLWALVDSEHSATQRLFAMRCTGQDCAGLTPYEYIGTFQVQAGTLVFHVFDLGEFRRDA